MNYKKIFLSIAIVTVFVFSFNLVSAKPGKAIGNDNQSKNKNLEEIKGKKIDKYCDQIQKKLDKIKNEVLSREEKLKNKSQEREANWLEKQTARDNKLAEFSSKRDANLEEHFKKLAEKAGTDEQKIAVNNFHIAMKKAIGDRRIAIKKAITDFRKGMSEIINSRKNARNSYAESFRVATMKALEKSSADCASGSLDGEKIRTTLKASLKAGKDELIKSKQGIEKANVSIEALIKVRKKAIEDANAIFKVAVEKAKVDFKVAMAAAGKTENETDSVIEEDEDNDEEASSETAE